MKKRILILAGVALSVIVPVAVKAGLKSTSTVSVGTTGASGSKGDARASGDGNQYIGCRIYYNAGNSGATTLAQCFAHDSASGFFWCQSSLPEVLTVVSSINDASYVSIGAPSSGSTCSYVQVDSLSYSRPMTP